MYCFRLISVEYILEVLWFHTQRELQDFRRVIFLINNATCQWDITIYKRVLLETKRASATLRIRSKQYCTGVLQSIANVTSVCMPVGRKEEALSLGEGEFALAKHSSTRLPGIKCVPL